MEYKLFNAERMQEYCEAIFRNCGFSEEEGHDIAEVLLTADLYGIESHGVQRMIRYWRAIEAGTIKPGAPCECVYETPVSAVFEGRDTMGQVVGMMGMRLAIEKARKMGFGAVTIRNTNHFGIAGYYSLMAADADMIGIAMTNTEAIAIPTNGKKAMLGTSPIAVAMPADPTPFAFDCATTVVTRGKLEVYNKRGEPLPEGWTADENGLPCADANRVINNIIRKAGGGIFPLGGATEDTGSHKGYGLGMIVELFTSIISGGTTSPHVARSGESDVTLTFLALDYGMFGDKKEIKARMSTLMQELRDSPKADGATRIYTHGEKEFESAAEKRINGIPLNEVTIRELTDIGAKVGLNFEEWFR